MTMNFRAESETPAEPLGGFAVWPQGEQTRDPLRPAWWELCSIGLLIGTILACDEAIGAPAHDGLNLATPAILMITLALGALRMARLEPRSVWSSLYWFRLATAVYFGFGSLVPSLLDPISLVTLNQFYEARPDEILKLNLVVAVSSFVVLACASTASILFPMRPLRAGGEYDENRLLFGILFASVGYTVKMLVEAPLTFGAFGAAAVPGAVLQLAQLSAVGLYLLAAHALRGNRPLLLIVIALLGADMFIGALEFSKFAMLLPLMMVLLAWLASRMTIARAALATGVFVAAYSSAQPFIEFRTAQPRAKIYDRQRGNFGERFEIATQYVNGARHDRYEEDTPTGMMRLSYVSAGCFAISRFDSGSPGPRSIMRSRRSCRVSSGRRSRSSPTSARSSI